MSLLFNTLPRSVIPFLPRSNRLLISWLQSPSAVILEPMCIYVYIYKQYKLWTIWLALALYEKKVILHKQNLITCALNRSRQWHPTPVLLPGKSMDGGAWWAAVHGVSKSWTLLSDFTFTFHFHALEKEMATHSSVLAWRIPGMGRLVGCHLWGHTESGTTEAT